MCLWEGEFKDQEKRKKNEMKSEEVEDFKSSCRT
jgi:hypothetical protein